MKMKLFLCMMLVSYHELVLTSQFDNRFNELIESYIYIDIDQERICDEDKKIHKKIAEAIENFDQHPENWCGLPLFLQEPFDRRHYDSNFYNYQHTVAIGIALYHQAHRNVVFNNQYRFCLYMGRQIIFTNRPI